MIACLQDALKQPQQPNQPFAQDQSIVPRIEAPTGDPHQSLRNLPDEIQQEVLVEPARYLAVVNPDDVDWIIARGGEVTGAGIGFSKKSILHAAAASGLTEVMTRFGEQVKFFDEPKKVVAAFQSANINPYPESFEPVLHSACRRNFPNLEMLDILLNLGANVNTKALIEPSTGQVGPTALHILAKATHWWHIDAIQLLVEKGAKIDETNEKGETPLHISSVGNTLSNMGENLGLWKVKCVEVFLDLGADPTILDNLGESCLDRASDAPEVMRLLLKRGAELKPSSLFCTIEKQNYQAVGVVLDQGVSVDALDTTKSCQIHYEIKDQARLALLCAAFPYIINTDIRDSVPLVKLLIERGANLYTSLNDRETLIHYVFEHADYSIVCAFLDFSDGIYFDRKDQVRWHLKPALSCVNNTD